MANVDQQIFDASIRVRCSLLELMGGLYAAWSKEPDSEAMKSAVNEVKLAYDNSVTALKTLRENLASQSA